MLTLVLALLARIAGTLTTGGAIAGFVVGMCVSAGFGLAGLAVLGTFFVAGSLATRIGWKTKKARGTAEAGEGRRDAKRVLGKGGVAAAVALVTTLRPGLLGPSPEIVFAGSVAAALADTLGTEIGLLWTGRVIRLPAFALVAAGTPGGLSWLGTAASAFGAALVGAVATGSGLVLVSDDPAKAALQSAMTMLGITTAGFAGALLESLAVGCGLRAPGFVRNVLTTLAGAAIGRGTWVVR